MHKENLPEKAKKKKKNLVHLFYFTLLLLSEHILCKESIVSKEKKKIYLGILTRLYIFRSPEFIYAIFTVMYGCICVCMCVYVSEHYSV